MDDLHRETKPHRPDGGCPVCGRVDAIGWGFLDGMRMCHGRDDVRPTCYEQVVERYGGVEEFWWWPFEGENPPPRDRPES